MWVGWPNTLHMVQGGYSYFMVGFSTFFPLLLVFLVITISFSMGISFEGIFVIVSLIDGASLGSRGINPLEVMFVAPVMVGETKNQNRIEKDTFRNTTIAKTCCDTKPDGG